VEPAVVAEVEDASVVVVVDDSDIPGGGIGTVVVALLASVAAEMTLATCAVAVPKLDKIFEVPGDSEAAFVDNAVYNSDE
jgi:hypothetical protein